MLRTVLLVLVSFTVIAAGCSGDGQAAKTQTIATTVPAGTGATTAPSPLPKLVLEPILSGFTRPTQVTNAGDGSGRLLVVEKQGTIRVVKDGVVSASPFLDIRSLVNSADNERGLLGLAFHPKFAENGRFFVGYTAKNEENANTFAEYRVPKGSTTADPASARVLIAIPDKFSNHNGGMLAFGPDGYLYLGTGDGGSGGDPDRNGQKLSTLLAKILRIDVDSSEQPYGIPKDNPFARRGDARPETWAYGLRNPWRFSFDRATGDLWIADVGQNNVEEINFQPAASKGGENYGWSVMEGNSCFRPPDSCNRNGLVLPIHDYSHADGGCSVTGGYVYRGKSIPALRGAYLLADYCLSVLSAIRRDGGRTQVDQPGASPKGISAFGEDESGEIYAVSDIDGKLYRLAATK